MRLFNGIPLASEVTAELAALVSRLRRDATGLRWPAPESWHITLQFLGNASPDQLHCLIAVLGEVRSAPVPIQLGELGSFDRAGVFFADVVVSAGLASLQESVVRATGTCSFVAETRPFHPHITLARKAGSEEARQRRSQNGGDRSRGLRELIAKAGACRFTRFTAREFLLYESHLGAEGSRYEVRGRFALGSIPG